MSNWRFYLDGNEVEEPIGWDAIEFTAIRMDSDGIDQPFSTEVKFYAEGAKYIKSIYDQYFINQPIAITITSDVDYNNAPFQFDGFLNLAIYTEHNVCDTDTWEITVGIIDDQFRENFKSRIDVEIDLTSTKDLNGATIPALTEKSIRLHSQELLLKAYGKNLADSVAYLSRPPSGPSFNTYGVVPTYWQQSDFTQNYGKTIDTNANTVTGDGNLPGGSVIFYNNTGVTRTISYSIDIDFTFRSLDPSGSVIVSLALAQFGGNTPQSFPPSINLWFNTNLGPLQSNTVNTTFNGSFTVNPGITVAFIAGVYTNTPSNPAVEFTVRDGYRISLTENNSSRYASLSNCLTIEQWLRRCIYMMTGSNNKLLSDTFSEANDGCYWNNALINGLRIRNADIDTNLKKLNTSWKETFDELNKIFCLGWAFEWTGSEWKIRVEKRSYFYQNIVSQTFESVGELDQSAMTDKLINTVQIGYNDNWKNIQLAGTTAIHTNRTYFIENRAMKDNGGSVLDLRTNYIAEGYTIEFYRRLSELSFGGATSDRPNDYQTFIIWLNRYELTGTNIENTPLQLPGESNGAYTFAPGTVSMPSNFITQSGSPLSGLYNIYHTPARVAYRWWQVLGMHTYGLSNPRLKFTSGEYQIGYYSIVGYQQEKLECIELQTGLSYGGVREDDDVTPDKMADAYKAYLFKPIQVEFEYPQSLCDFLTLSQDEQYRKVKLTSGSLAIEGFILNATNQPENASGGTTKFTLLVSNQQSEPGGAFDEGYDTGYVVE
jgi:hypothetical protein